jgi:hypothetical protein
MEMQEGREKKATALSSDRRAGGIRSDEEMVRPEVMD